MLQSQTFFCFRRLARNEVWTGASSTEGEMFSAENVASTIFWKKEVRKNERVSVWDQKEIGNTTKCSKILKKQTLIEFLPFLSSLELFKVSLFVIHGWESIFWVVIRILGSTSNIVLMSSFALSDTPSHSLPLSSNSPFPILSRMALGLSISLSAKGVCLGLHKLMYKSSKGQLLPWTWYTSLV